MNTPGYNIVYILKPTNFIFRFQYRDRTWDTNILLENILALESMCLNNFGTFALYSNTGRVKTLAQSLNKNKLILRYIESISALSFTQTIE